MTRRAFQVSAFAALLALAAFASATVNGPAPVRAADKVAAPAHQVIACYFHRTQRCPTCQRIGGYIQEAVKTGFAAEIQEGTVKVMEIDFQDAKNQKFTQAYKITGPTLVIMDVRDGKVAAWKPAPKVWSLVGQKDQFFAYVQGEVRAYHDGKAAAR